MSLCGEGDPLERARLPVVRPEHGAQPLVARRVPEELVLSDEARVERAVALAQVPARHVVRVEVQHFRKGRSDDRVRFDLVVLCAGRIAGGSLDLRASLPSMSAERPASNVFGNKPRRIHPHIAA